MKTPPRLFVCKRCGVSLSWWCGKTWKHVANQHTPTCGKPAIPVKRNITDEQHLSENSNAT